MDYHDNLSVHYQQKLPIPGLESRGWTKKIMYWCVLSYNNNTEFQSLYRSNVFPTLCLMSYTFIWADVSNVGYVEVSLYMSVLRGCGRGRGEGLVFCVSSTPDSLSAA